jgi:hypothetical protein
MSLVGWSPCSPGTACPRCGTAGRVEVRQVLRAKPPGSHSLAGSQLKVSAVAGWEFRCLACGASGPAEPKETAEEQERLIRAAAEDIA